MDTFMLIVMAGVMLFLFYIWSHDEPDGLA